MMKGFLSIIGFVYSNKMKKKFPKVMVEKIKPCYKEIVIRSQEEIDSYNKNIGYRKARVKRYGWIPKSKKE